MSLRALSIPDATAPDAGPGPTADLYLRWSCADRIARGDLVALGPTLFRAGGTLIVLRHVSGMRALPPHDRVILVADDDWHGGLWDRTLPLAYRMKLALTECRDASRVEARADTVLVSSDRLARLYAARLPGRRIVRIDPAWTPPQSAPDGIRADIAWLGSPAHAGDLRLAIETIELCRQARPGLRVIVAGGARVPRHWRRDPRILRLPDMPWPRWLAFLRRARIGIVLYPLAPGAFNAARSVNKLLEADQVGAVLLASDCWAAGHAAARGGYCKLLGDSPRDWAAAVLGLIDDPETRQRIAARTRAHIAARRGLATQAALWEGLL
ncbi:glycosyltransferase family 1 protein [Palleronia sediminis]|uniref:Glycosyltransferase family 1 protein n=1 Tax=Palleronia sediminis TaxID=2547833 RepID=A0A4R6AH58_9RHOB|nr:glycosyltransferase family 1 protein [Palleronia sediminis]TDL83511.1 glycosyltransferase family 1 protein [Palleronia sediminis]